MTTPTPVNQGNDKAIAIIAGTGLLIFGICWGIVQLADWAYTRGLFTTDPVLTIPRTRTPGVGPTWQICIALGITLATLALCALAVALTAAQSPRLPTRAWHGAIAAAITTTLLWLMLLLLPTHQALALCCATLLAALIITLSYRPLTRILHRQALIRLLDTRIRPLLGSPDRRRIVSATWSAQTPELPHELTIRNPNDTRITERTLTDAAEIIDQCIPAGDYQLRNDIPTATIKATLKPATTTAPNEPEQIARLRSDVASPQFFEDGARVDNIDLNRTTGQVVAFDVHHSISRKLVDTPRPRAIERRLGMLLGGGRWRATDWDWKEGTVHFGLRRELPPMILPLPAPAVTPADTTPDAIDAAKREVIDAYPDTAFTYGIDEDGNLLSWQPRVLPHTLVIGATGSGKTSLTQTVIVDATRKGWPVIIIDFKGIEYTQFRGWPNVTMIIDTIEHAVAVIHHFYLVMLRRYEAVKRDPGKLNHIMPFLLVVDEYAEFMDRLNTFYASVKVKGEPRRCPTLDEIDSILRLARSSRMHGYFGLQRPDQKIMDSGASRDQMTHRVSVGPLTSQGAQMMWGSAFIGRTIPAGVRGRATTRNRKNEPVEFQCFYTPNPELDSGRPQLVEHFNALRPPAALWERQVVEHATPEDDNALEDGFVYYQTRQVYTAADRPDLDPYSDAYKPASNAEDLSDFDVASGYLGTTTTTSTPTPNLHIVTTPQTSSPSPSDDDFTWTDAYEDATDHAVADLTHGDLILIDPDSDRWALVDGDPAPVDDNHITIYWRDVMTGEEGDTMFGSDDTTLFRAERELESA